MSDIFMYGFPNQRKTGTPHLHIKLTDCAKAHKSVITIWVN